MSERLPRGWQRAPLGSLGSWSGGGTPSTTNSAFWNSGMIPWVSAKDMKVPVIHDSEDHISEAAVLESAAKPIAPGSVLFVTRSGILSRTFPVARTAVPVTVNQDLKALTPSDGIDPDYIAWGVRADEYRILRQCARDGTTVASVDAKLLQAFELPIAPSAEQSRIVAAIESYLTRLDKAVATLEQVLRNLKRYRASVLKAAIEGRLVPTEAELARAERRSYEPASALLTRIAAERRRRWEETQLSKMTAKGKVPEDAKWKAKYVAPVAPDTRELPELPEGWCWATAAQIAAEKDGAICAGPFGTIFKAKDFRPTGVPIIQLRHVKPDRFLTQRQAYMGREKWEELFRNDYSVFGGELLITKLGDPPGDCAMFPAIHAPSMLTPDVMKLEVDERIVVPRFVMHYINSTVARRYMFGSAFGTTRLRLTLPLFRAMPIPIPPRAEQERIATAVDRLITVADEVDMDVHRDTGRCARLRQSILKWAFEGLLVDQDPTEEPAAVLLQRIRAGRSANVGSESKRRRKGRRGA